MSESIRDAIRPLLDAVSFAARAHDGQFRKDGATPYVSHVFRVCFVLRHVFEISDREVLTAALLHDTVEDTRTDCDDLVEAFGEQAAGWVATLTKDKRLPDALREEAYCAGLSAAPWPVRVAKLADVFDNLMDSANLPPAKRQRTLDRSRVYLQALRPRDDADPAGKPWKLVSNLIDEIAADAK